MASSASRRIVVGVIVAGAAFVTQATVNSETVGNLLYLATVLGLAVLAPTKTVEK